MTLNMKDNDLELCRLPTPRCPRCSRRSVAPPQNSLQHDRPVCRASVVWGVHGLRRRRNQSR